jgi:hypothetical protein
MSTPKPTPKLPDRDALAQLDTAFTTIEADREALNKRARALEADFTSKHHVHSDAFALFRKLLHMPPVESAAFVRHLLHYISASDLDKQRDFFQEPLDGKVTQLRSRDAGRRA